MVAAASADGKVRWVVTTASGCSDCEDNALGGAVSGSEAFPTGHAHPPAPPVREPQHPGPAEGLLDLGYEGVGVGPFSQLDLDLLGGMRDTDADVH